MTTESMKNPMDSKGMEEPSPGAEMTDVEMREEAVSGMPARGMELEAGTMPASGMGESAETEEEMPKGSMDEPAETAGEMPAGDMEEPAGGPQEMPLGGMGDVESGPDRFRPTKLPPGSIPPTVLEPGVVEVEFRDGVRPQVVPTAAGTPTAIASPAGVNFTAFNQILQRYQLERAELSFKISEQEAAQAQAVAQQQGATVPNLGNFVTLHFPADADMQRIVQDLSQLPEVERAVAVPKAIPPQTPLNEPLVGNSDQVVLNPVTGFENQWYVFRCRANHAWTMASGDGVVIADIDWGYRTSHQDLASRLDLAWKCYRRECMGPGYRLGPHGR